MEHVLDLVRVDDPGHVQKVVLARLRAGHSIPRHVDGNPMSAGARKFHVPLVTHDDVVFDVEGSSYGMPSGTVYELNNALEHAVFNRSTVDRIHLIIEVSWPVKAMPR